MKNVCKVKAIRKITGIIAIVMAVMAFDALLITGCSDGGGNYIPPEDKPVKDRWGKWIADDATATLEYSVDDNGVSTITVGGTAQPNNETDDWGQWKANAAYDYTAQAGKSYSYKFEAWTKSGTRDLYFQYNTDNDEKIYKGETVSITNTRTTYTVYGQPLSRNVLNHVEFQCADQLGTFYVKILEIKELIPDSALNGTWVTNHEEFVDKMKFNNGNYEASYQNFPVEKGTYTTDSGIIKIKITHINPHFLDEVDAYAYGLESKCYSKDDLEEILGYGDWEDYFVEATVSYSVTGNTLKFSYDGDVVVYTRK